MRHRASSVPGQRLPALDSVRSPTSWRIAFAIAATLALGSVAWLGVTTRGEIRDDRQRVNLELVRDADVETTAPTSTDSPDAAAVTPPIQVIPSATPTRLVNPALQRNLVKLMDSLPAGMSASVHRLSDGASASHDAETVFYAASLFKLAVLYEAEREQSTGELDFSSSIYPDFSEDLGTSGELPLADDGSLSIGEAIHYMIMVSDNASAVALMHLMGTARIDQTLFELGLRNTSVNMEGLPTTAADMARLMEAIVTGEGLSQEAVEHARALLLGQAIRFGIPALLPTATVAGNKTGTWEGALHDVAFVQTPSGTYVIAILTDGSLGWEAIADASRNIFDLLEVG